MNQKNQKKKSEGLKKTIRVIVETPCGSKDKLELDVATGKILLDRTNTKTLPFPFDYGFIPNTESGDGDSLDVVVLSQEKTKIGEEVLVHPVGIMYMKDSGEQDDKVITRQTEDAETNLTQEEKQTIRTFFENYKDSDVVVQGFGDVDEAYTTVEKARKKA